MKVSCVLVVVFERKDVIFKITKFQPQDTVFLATTTTDEYKIKISIIKLDIGCYNYVNKWQKKQKVTTGRPGNNKSSAPIQ